MARTEIVERSVIQITLNQTGAHQIDVKQEKAEEKEKRKRFPLTEEAFWELLKKRSPDNYENVRQIIDEYRERDGISIDPAEGSMIVRLSIPDSGEQVSVFFVTKNAELRVWPRTVVRQLKEAGFDPSLGESYAAQMRNIMKMPEKKTEFGRPMREVNIDKFKSAVDTFIRNIQLAQPIND